MKSIFKIIPLLIAVFIFINTAAQTVVICEGKYSKKYHSSENCRGLNNCKGGLSNISLSNAQQIGRSACSICNPPTQVQSNSQSSAPNTYQQQNTIKPEHSKTGTSEQCNATTKAGNRCKRMTKSPNGRCWQHGGN